MRAEGKEPESGWLRDLLRMWCRVWRLLRGVEVARFARGMVIEDDILKIAVGVTCEDGG